MRRLTKALGLVSVLAMTSPAIGQETCLFQSHSIDPPNPGPFQPFTVTVTVLASCVAYYPPEVASNVVTVDVECICAIPLPPPPILWTHSFVVSGLPAGAATVEFVDHFANPPSLFYSFGLVVGSAIDIPSIEGQRCRSAGIPPLGIGYGSPQEPQVDCGLPPNQSLERTRWAPAVRLRRFGSVARRSAPDPLDAPGTRPRSFASDGSDIERDGMLSRTC